MENKNEGMTFYRCVLCREVVSVWDIQEHKGCSKCGNSRLMPSNLTLFEKLKQIIKHPKIWDWKNVSV